MRTVWVTLAAAAMLIGTANAAEVWRDGDKSLELGWWGQAWYQWVEEGKVNADKGTTDDLSDFVFRRSYFYIKGTATQWLSFFAHLAGDRYGQEGQMDDSGKGLGSGVGFRDGWVNLKLCGDEAQLQLGRMYVPFTRNYGTTSTKALMTLDLDWFQGGIRGGIFYPNNVGRDDAATLWGNLWDGLVQYRAMVGDGSSTPSDDVRYAGRVSFSLWDKETGWFNEGTYLDKKKVLSIGIGGDRQERSIADPTSTGTFKNYGAWTADLFYSRPLNAGGAVTTEVSYIGIDNAANGVGNTALKAGDDANLYTVKLGYLIPGAIGPGQVMPYAHWQFADVDSATHKANEETMVYGLGAQYFVLGHGNKISLELTRLDQDKEVKGTAEVDEFLVTLQLAAGF